MFFRRKPTNTTPNFIKPDGQNAFRVRVKTSKHAEVVEVRLTKSGDISNDGGGFYVRKHVVAPNSFDRAVLEIHFGLNYSQPMVRVEGGEAVPVKEWL